MCAWTRYWKASTAIKMIRQCRITEVMLTNIATQCEHTYSETHIHTQHVHVCVCVGGGCPTIVSSMSPNGMRQCLIGFIKPGLSVVKSACIMRSCCRTYSYIQCTCTNYSTHSTYLTFPGEGASLHSRLLGSAHKQCFYQQPTRHNAN